MHLATYILLTIAFAVLALALVMRAEQKHYGKAKSLKPLMGNREELIAALQDGDMSDPRQNSQAPNQTREEKRK
jgi:hypothetical protein